MAERPMLMLVCYDIAQARARARIAATLEEQAVRVQESVFEVRLTERQAAALFNTLADWVSPGDSLRMYGVSAAGLARSRAVGGAPIPDDAPYWIV